MRLLLIEDDVELSALQRLGLEQAGFEADQTYTAEDALTSLRAQAYDLIVLDLNLPDRDGMALLKDIRAKDKNIPVLILTARVAKEHRLKGLNGGADDYLVKPFDLDELVARVRVLLRRPRESLGTVLEAGNITFDMTARAVGVAGKPLSLTRRELDLLEQLMRCAGHVLNRELIEARLYSHGDNGSANAIEASIYRLRGKLEKAGAEVEIHTVHGVGYKLEPVALSP